MSIILINKDESSNAINKFTFRKESKELNKVEMRFIKTQMHKNIQRKERTNKQIKNNKNKKYGYHRQTCDVPR